MSRSGSKEGRRASQNSKGSKKGPGKAADAGGFGVETPGNDFTPILLEESDPFLSRTEPLPEYPSERRKERRHKHRSTTHGPLPGRKQGSDDKALPDIPGTDQVKLPGPAHPHGSKRRAPSGGRIKKRIVFGDEEQGTTRSKRKPPPKPVAGDKAKMKLKQKAEKLRPNEVSEVVMVKLPRQVAPNPDGDQFYRSDSSYYSYSYSDSD